MKFWRNKTFPSFIPFIHFISFLSHALRASAHIFSILHKRVSDRPLRNNFRVIWTRKIMVCWRSESKTNLWGLRNSKPPIPWDRRTICKRRGVQMSDHLSIPSYRYSWKPKKGGSIEGTYCSCPIETLLDHDLNLF